MATRGRLMQVNIKLLTFLSIWPNKDKETKYVRFLKDFLGFVNILIGTLGVTTDFIIQVRGKYDDLMDITENLTAIAALYGSVYMGICFIKNRYNLIKLIDEFEVFEEFGTTEKMLKTEKKANLLTKVFILYGILGNLIYFSVPFLNLTECRERRSHSKYSKDMPCELVGRFKIPVHYEHKKWSLYCVIIWQGFTCLNATTLTLSISTFIVAMLMQVIGQLQELQLHLRANKPIKECIRFHITIIEYASKLSQALSSTLLMYLTLISFQISILGFEVVMNDSITNSFRYALHLFGWLSLLYLVCNYGQQLVDESKAIGTEAYSIPWYDKSVSEQKDLKLMIMRSQKPLTLNAASLGTLSLESFLNVLSTAYSYFTLLLNMKKD